jgi:hypothetical protein
VPVVLGLRSRSWLADAEWNLGRWSRTVHVVASVYALAACLILVLPPNELAGKTLAALLAGLLLLWATRARDRYRAPTWVIPSELVKNAH